MPVDLPAEPLAPALAERVLERLGMNRWPSPDRAGLAALYAAWCRGVPMDNLRKLVHLRADDPGPLPGDTPEDFFAGWLAHGTGGTCWAVHGALTALLEACGFEARRGIGTMLVAPDLPPNHGLTSVRLDDETLLVDGCILHGEPLLLDAARETAVEHPAWGVRARPATGKWVVRWRSPFAPDGFDCRIDSLASDAGAFAAMHESTRDWSPFNFELFVRVHRDGGVLGTARGERITFRGDGAVERRVLAPQERQRFLVEEVGISEAFAQRVPDDVPMPPPGQGARG